MNFFIAVDILKKVCSVISLTYLFYLVVIGLCGLPKPAKLNRKGYTNIYGKNEGKKNRYAILTAARNEETVIGNLIETVKKQNYPAELIDIYVVPNNCTDNTESMAKNAGAEIIHCDVPVHTKGEVLINVFPKLLAYEKYDAFIVVDADNLMDPEFVKEMNVVYNAGYSAAQGYRDSKNPSDTCTSSCCSIYYWLDNRFFSQGRWNIGGSALINGTGFMVAADYLKKTGGWQTISLTEDIEFSGQCAINGARIAWARNAVVYDEQPLFFSQAFKQRMRWTSGAYQCIPRYWNSLIKGIFRKNKSAFMNFDMLLFYLFPLTGIFGVIAILLSFISTVGEAFAGYMTYTQAIMMIADSFLKSYFISSALAAAVVVFEGKNIWKSIKGILTFWIYIVSWAPITLLCLISKNIKWEEIKHTRNLNIEKLKEEI